MIILSLLSPQEKYYNIQQNGKKQEETNELHICLKSSTN